MTPQQLYDIIKSAYPQCEVTSLCHTNKTCIGKGFCEDKQSTNVIDFDLVKEIKYNGQTPTPASVDAVCVSSGKRPVFCFVEIKGWQLYIENMYHQRNSIQETATSYNLAGKLSDSQRLCMELASDKNLFANIPVRFVLVTDIDTTTNGIGALHSMLNQLGQTSTNVYSECLTQARRTLDSEIYIDREYITCKKFDNFLNLTL